MSELQIVDFGIPHECLVSLFTSLLYGFLQALFSKQGKHGDGFTVPAGLETRPTWALLSYVCGAALQSRPARERRSGSADKFASLGADAHNLSLFDEQRHTHL